MKESWLYIAQYFPPGNTVAARRFSQLAGSKNCPQFAIRRDQKTTIWPELPEVEIYTITSADLRSVMAKYANQTTVPTHKKRGMFARLLLFRQAFPFLLITDDGGLLYRRKAYRKACELVEKNGITTVFSSFRPWSDHLVAAKLKKRFPALRWIADFRDLPVDPVHQTIWWPALQRWWGKRIIRSADEVWMVSEGQQQQMAGWHPNIKVKYNALAELPPAKTAPESTHFTIVYTGSLYPELRTPEKLVFALQNLWANGDIDERKLRLVYRGKDDHYFRQFTHGLPEVMLDVKTSVTAEAARVLQADAQLLLLLTWSAPDYYGVLTAKLWEYLATGRPILALVKGPGDPEMKGIVEKANAGAVFSDSEPEQLENWLKVTYEQWERTGSVPNFPDRAKLQQYLVESAF